MLPFITVEQRSSSTTYPTRACWSRGSVDAGRRGPAAARGAVAAARAARAWWDERPLLVQNRLGRSEIRIMAAGVDGRAARLICRMGWGWGKASMKRRESVLLPPQTRPARRMWAYLRAFGFWGVGFRMGQSSAFDGRQLAGPARGRPE